VETLARYQILGELGRGGCGIVYSALDPAIGRKVAIKTIQADTRSEAGRALHERFKREARAAGGLSHPNIVTIHEFADTGDITYIVMEFVEGHTLADKMATGTPLSAEFILAILRAAADALDTAHARNIVHRDVKPANFLLTPSGNLKIADFGIAKLLGGEINLTNTGMVIGTAHYMSPEQVSAKPVTGRSDQFALAVIAYEMLAGRKPFQGDSWVTVLHQIMSADPLPVETFREGLGSTVTSVLLRALAKDPAQR
jgi:serine/threonine protein kinase